MTRAVHLWLQAPNRLAIAHRGGALENEENTPAAFAHAVALGYRRIETDVHLTADGEVVVHHDPTLARMTGDARPISGLTWGQLRALRTHGGEEIPRLADMIEHYPQVLFNIEAKSDAVVDPLADLLQRMGAAERIGTGSFSPARMRRLRARLGPALCWSPAHLGVLGLWVSGWGLPARKPPFPMVQVPRAFRGIPVVTPRFVQAAHRRGVGVQVWTVDDEAAMRALLEMGVDGLMTDRPSLLKQVLIERGDWEDG